jgi:predicted transposase YbfD/YdcC
MPKKMPAPRPPSEEAALLFVAHFADLKDPRRHRHKVHYPLPLLLLIAFAAILSGFDGWEAFAQFAEDKRDWLHSLWPFDGATPSAATFARVFNRLDAKAFAACFTRWTAALRDQLRGRHVALDGKSVLGARDPAAPSVPLHLLHAWLVDHKLLLGVAAIDGVAREPIAIREMLALLELRGAVVTIDAIGATRDITAGVVARHADFVIQLKANRRAEYAEVDLFFAPRVAALTTERFAATEAVDFAARAERGHGRAEWRQHWAVDAARFPTLQTLLPATRTVLCVVRSRRSRAGLACETHYYVSSLPPKAARIARFVRAHWSVENHLHRTLDVVLHEDAAQVRKGPAAENLAVIRRFAEAVTRRDTTYPRSMPQKLRHAALNDDYRTHLLTLEVS